MRDAGEEFLVLKHQNLSIEDARLIRTGAVPGALLEPLDETLDVLHGGAQPPHFLLNLGAGDDAVRHLGQLPARHDRGADRDAGRHADPAQQALAHTTPS